MSLSSHLIELQKKHETLAAQIEAEERHPSADDLEIRELKRMKLHLKEEIARKSGQLQVNS
jgi:hypothetical protein